MPRAFTQGFKDTATIRNVPLMVNPTGKVFYVNNSGVKLANAKVASNDGDGSFWKPYSTIDHAINQCTAHRGDVIYVMPGHAETITGATGIVPDVAGVSIVGLGTGEKRPIITAATSATAAIPISGANTTIKNLVFKCNIASQNHMLDVKADDVLIEDCEFREGTATGLSFITADTADGDSDRLTIRNCKFHAPTAGNYDNAISLAKDFVGVRIEDCEIYGNFDDAGISVPAGGNAQVDLQIGHCKVVNTLTGQHAIEINSTTNTGMIYNTYCVADTFDTIIDSGGLAMFNALQHDNADQTYGTFAGTVAS